MPSQIDVYRSETYGLIVGTSPPMANGMRVPFSGHLVLGIANPLLSQRLFVIGQFGQVSTNTGAGLGTHHERKDGETLARLKDSDSGTVAH